MHTDQLCCKEKQSTNYLASLSWRIYYAFIYTSANSVMVDGKEHFTAIYTEIFCLLPCVCFFSLNLVNLFLKFIY